MVVYSLRITADEMENVKSLQPMGGLQDRNFNYYFTLKCENCGVTAEKNSCVNLNTLVPIPKTNDLAHLVQKCKNCDRVGTVIMVPETYPYRQFGYRRTILEPLSDDDCQKGIYKPLMGFECSGLEPSGVFFLGSQWKVKSNSGTVFVDVDLSSGDWSEYDEDENQLVAVSNLRAGLFVAHRYQSYYPRW